MLKLMFFFSVASFFAGIKIHALAVSKNKRDFVLSTFAYVAVAVGFALIVFQ